jgi:hypothetical protein
MAGIEGEGPLSEPTAREPRQPEQTQPQQGRAAGRESLQGPTTLDGYEPDAWQPDPTQQSGEGNPSVASVEQKAEGNAARPSRIPDYKSAFVQQAYAVGADKSLDERLRLFIAHAVTKPHLKLQELAPFAGVTTAEMARHLWDKGLRALWEASPPELQQQYPLDLLRRHRSTGVPFSADRRAHLSETHKGKPLSAERRAKLIATHTGKKRSPETRARLSVALRKSWERRKQQQAADLIQSEQEQYESSLISSSPKKP